MPIFSIQTFGKKTGMYLLQYNILNNLPLRILQNSEIIGNKPWMACSRQKSLVTLDCFFPEILASAQFQDDVT